MIFSSPPQRAQLSISTAFGRCRAVEAERQLRHTSMTITQIAYFLGFEDPAYFSRFFSKRVGVSPRAFRDKLHGI